MPKRPVIMLHDIFYDISQIPSAFYDFPQNSGALNLCFTGLWLSCLETGHLLPILRGWVIRRRFDVQVAERLSMIAFQKQPVARLIGCLLALIFLAPVSAVWAATITATVTDEDGKPLPQAVVTITPAFGGPRPPLEAGRLATAKIDQVNEAFVPSVVVIRTGGSVTFRNSDGLRHHVYSFSPIRQFEMVQAPGTTSQPIRFDAAGTAAIGCNIHDHMIAYVHVTDAPWAMVTNEAGMAVITDVPAGRFLATVWHPRVRPTFQPPVQPITIVSQHASLEIVLSVLPPRRLRPRDY